MPTTSSDCVIRLDGVSKTYYTGATETHALRNVHLEIRSGEFVAVAGPSGCGKTTLISIMGLLDAPSAGQYQLDGVPVQQIRPSVRASLRNRSIGFIFQSFNLIADLTVMQNVELPLVYASVSARERRNRTMSVLDRLELASKLHDYPEQLSGGQQQRVAVARALIGRPRLLLADEPTGNLDTAAADGVMDLLRDLNREGATICMVTHEPRFFSAAKRTLHLLDGRIVRDS